MQVLGLLLAFFLSFTTPSVFSADGPSIDKNRIVAVVNDEAITEAELHRALVPAYLQLRSSLGPEELAKEVDDLKQQVLQELIDERLMLQEARNPRQVEVGKGKIGTPPAITVSEEEVQELLGDAKGRFETPEEFEDALRQQGITEEELRGRFREQITIRKLINREVRSRLTVSPAEVTAYYQIHQQEFITPLAVQVATLLIRPRDNQDFSRAHAQAQDLHRQLEKGADFYELARRYSEGFNAKMGGRIGLLEKGRSLKEIDHVLFDLKVGQISPIIRTPAGFQIFLIESIRPARQAELGEAQKEIQARLLQEKGEGRYHEWITKLRSESYISIK